MRRAARALLIAAVLVAGGESRAQEAESGDAFGGRRLAEQRCGACHAVGKADLSPLPKAPRFRDLHRRYDVEDLAEALAEGMVTGHPAMPSAPFLEPEVRDLIAYLRTLEAKDPGKP